MLVSSAERGDPAPDKPSDNKGRFPELQHPSWEITNSARLGYFVDVPQREIVLVQVQWIG